MFWTKKLSVNGSNSGYCNRMKLRSLAGSLLTLALLLTGCQTARHTDRDTLTLVQLCDPQIGFRDYPAELARLQQAVRQINELHPDLVVVCGDLVNRADEPSFADFNQATAALRMPVRCAPGNHDLGNVPTANSLALYRRSIGPDYYSFQQGGYRFIIANTQLWKANVPGESERHDAWFKSTIREAARRGEPVVVACHYPPYEKSPDEPEAYFNLPPPKRAELLDLFRECGVVAVLVGHAHKTIIHDYHGIAIVASETTSENFDKRPYGFRVWRLTRHYAPEHRFVPLKP